MAKPATRARGASDSVNYLNIGLMGLSCVAAYALPFHLFLAAYAILGPAHYLTEISWLHDRQYFSRGRYDFLLMVLLSVMAVYPRLLGAESLVYDYDPLFIALAAGAAMAFIQRPLFKWLTIAAIAVLAGTFSHERWAFLLFGIFLPTLIHVFLFTWAFVFYGALKERSFSGILSLAVFTLLASTYFFLPAPETVFASNYIFSNVEAFGSLPQEFAALFGWEGGSGLVASMRFIAFAYTYHYLNWFSKTQVIRWHEVSRKRVAAIAVLYVIFIGTYAYDYRLGLSTLGLLSLGHVLLEFPLNFHSFAGIGRELWSLSRPKSSARPGPRPVKGAGKLRGKKRTSRRQAANG